MEHRRVLSSIRAPVKMTLFQPLETITSSIDLATFCSLTILEGETRICFKSLINLDVTASLSVPLSCSLPPSYMSDKYEMTLCSCELISFRFQREIAVEHRLDQLRAVRTRQYLTEALRQGRILLARSIVIVEADHAVVVLVEFLEDRSDELMQNQIGVFLLVEHGEILPEEGEQFLSLQVAIAADVVDTKDELDLFVVRGKQQQIHGEEKLLE